MKKLIHILIFGILVVSCLSNDDNEPKTLEEQILDSSWFFQRHGEVCSGASNLSEGDPYEFRFLSNNTVEFDDPGYLTSSSYSINGNELTLETIYTLPSGSKRKFIGNYTFSEVDEKFTGTNTFDAYNDTGTLWTCSGTTSIFR